MTPQIDDYKPTASLYTRGDESVRVEMYGARGSLWISVFGPGSQTDVREFTDSAALMSFRQQFEQVLLQRGFRLQAVAERRSLLDDLQERLSTGERRRGRKPVAR